MMRRVAPPPKPTLRDRLAGVLDSAIGFVAPATELRRRLARNAKQMQLATYRGAETDRIQNNWMDRVSSADDALLDDLEALRDRSRELNRDNPDAAAITQSIVDNVVGSGLHPQSTPDRRALEEAGVSPEAIDDFVGKAERAFRIWSSREADSTNRLSFEAIQAQAIRQVVEAGESFVHLVLLPDDGIRMFSLACELIEPDRVADPDGQEIKKNMRSGIRLGKRGEPIAYIVHRQHPGETGILGPRRHFTIRARDELGEPRMLHMYHQDRPGQTRGQPFFAPSIEMFRMHGDLKEALVVSAQARACFVAFIQKNELPELYAAKKANPEGQRLEELAPGLVQYLSPGETVSFGDPSASSPDADGFGRYIMRSIAASVGMPYEVAFKDFSETTYTSGRASSIEGQRTINRHRALLTSKICDPVWWRFVDEAFARSLLGNVPMFKQLRHAWSAVRWIPPARGWVDPLKEIQASVLAVENDISTLPNEVAAQGGDWESNIETAARVARKRAEEGTATPGEEEQPPEENEDTDGGDDA